MKQQNNKTLNLKPIKDYMKKNNLSIAKFCKMCDIRRSSFDGLMKGNRKTRLTTLLNICKTIHVSSDVIVFNKKRKM